MTIADFLAELSSRDIQVWADGEHLRCNAPAGALLPELQDRLRRQKAEIIRFLHAAEALSRQQRAIVPLQPRGDRVPIFAVAGHNGDVFAYRALARLFADEQPLYGLQPLGLDGERPPLESVEELAAYFAAQILAFRPDGPFVIAGYCAGGTIAFELARQLQQHDAEISFVALFGSPYPNWYRFLPQFRRCIAEQAARVSNYAHALGTLSGPELGRHIAARLRHRRAEREALRAAAADPVLVRRALVGAATLAAVRRYTPTRFDGCLALFQPNRMWCYSSGWEATAREVREYFGPDGCTGDNMLRDTHVAVFAELFRRCRVGEWIAGVAGETWAVEDHSIQ